MPLETIPDDKDRQIAKIMTEELTKALYESGRFAVVERENLAYVLREIGFQMTGAVDPNKAVKAGQMLGAQYIVIGKITMAGLELSSMAMLGLLGNNNNNNSGFASLFGAIGNLAAASTGALKGKLALTYRIIDVQTGEIKIMGQAEGLRRGNGTDTIMYEVCKEAAKNVLKDMVQNVRAKIADVSDKMIYIDLGIDGGYHKGETLEIVRETNPIEVNGKIVGMKEIIVGTAKVTEVNDEYSICKITSHTDTIKKGDIVKRTKKK